MAQPSPSATVYLVGAGPGDPGLITVRGLELLRRADVVVHDALANPALLDEAPPSAPRHDVGKRGGDHKLSQDQINQLLVDLARQHRCVVRLKGGDPYLFGRGAEEALYLARHGIACEVVPGVTSGIAAPAYAGIPVTHRQLASTVTFVTGHEDPRKVDSAIDYPALAQLIRAGGTVCFYMGAGNLSAITAKLRQAGLSPDTPLAIVQWGTTPRQRSLRTTLTAAPTDVQRAGLASPAIIIVGPVAAIDEPALQSFTRRPLFGQRILITRTRQQASELRSQLAQLGADVLEAPTIELVPPTPEKLAALDAALRNLSNFDWLVLTSPNGVTALAQRLETLGLDARALAPLKIAAMGDGTDRALGRTLGVRADFVPTRFVAESLAGQLTAAQDVRGRRFLLLRADIARPTLPHLLAQAGARVTELTAYETTTPACLPPAALQALRDGAVHWVTFTSASTCRHLAQLLGREIDLLGACQLASIGPITTEALRDLGLTPTVEAATSNIPGLVDAIVRHVTGHPT